LLVGALAAQNAADQRRKARFFCFIVHSSLALVSSLTSPGKDATTPGQGSRFLCSQSNIQAGNGPLISTSARYLIHEGAFEDVG
jgi:hypothetical protein